MRARARQISTPVRKQSASSGPRRGTVMTRRTSGTFDPARAMERIAEETSKQTAFLEASFERVIDRVDMLQEDVQKGNLDRDHIVRELVDVKRQVTGLEDDLRRHVAEQTQAAAKGAAEGATAAAVAPMEQARVATNRLNRNQQYALGAVGLLWLTSFFDKGPAIMKGLQAIWTAMVGLSK